MKAFKEKADVKNPNLWISTVLFFAFFAFYFVFSIYVLPQAVDQPSLKPIVQAIFSFVVAFSIVAGAFLLEKVNHMKVVFVSSGLTAFAVAALLLIPEIVATPIGLAAILMSGVVFGFGQLSFFAYFWEQYSNYGRGKVAGKIGFIALIPYFVLNAAVVEDAGIVETLGIALIPLLMAVGVSFIYLRRRKLSFTVKSDTVYHEKRTILLYTIPWVFFCLINATLAKNITSGSNQLVSSYFIPLALIQTIASLIGAYSSGVIADYFGRRPALAISVTLYGISMALSGFVPSLIFFSVATAAEGLSWGMLLTLYSFVIWGDLANQKNRAKIYAIGLVAFYFSVAVGQLPTFLSQISPANSVLISCSIIFLSNTPILLAPELLSIDVRQKLTLRKYIDHLKRNEAKLRA